MTIVELKDYVKPKVEVFKLMSPLSFLDQGFSTKVDNDFEDYTRIEELEEVGEL